MMHFTCDGCGKPLPAGEERFVVEVEVYAAHDPGQLTEADLDQDQLEALSEALQELDDLDEVEALEPTTRRLRYDLCPHCRTRYLRDPLGKKADLEFDFSEN